MPRILVADDNSNIQKMVTLALKDIGIDVVAVPNGEAAVRKLTDANLDLVLADIFMPVRSGYEVCDYIKQDPRYSHLPVVLLVGAFDPLDEREAQRVGADGILKKPFVPPDPLINMVKNLLAKSASERLVSVAAPAVVTPSSAETETVFSPKHATEQLPPIPPPAEFSDIPFEEFGPPVGTLDFSDQENPMAFSNLLEAPTADDRDLVLTAHRDPSLGEPLWSHPPADAAETQNGETSEEEALQDHTWGSHGPALPLGIDSTVLPSIPHKAEPIDGIDGGEKESPALLEAAQKVEVSFEAGNEIPVKTQSEPQSETRSEHRGDPIFESAIEEAVEHEATLVFDGDHKETLEMTSIPAIDLAAGEIALETSRPIESSEVSLTPESYSLPEESPVPEAQETAPGEIESSQAQFPDVIEHVQNAEPIASDEVVHTDPEHKPTGFHAWMATVASIFQPVATPLEDPVSHSEISDVESFSAPQVASNGAPALSAHEEHPQSVERSEHDGQVEQAGQFDRDIPPAKWPSAFEPKTPELASFGDEIAPSLPEISGNSVHATESESTSNGAAVAESQPESPVLETPATALDSAPLGSRMQSPEMVEAMVTRIVERMQPKVFDAVTREILRPLVEALVRREMQKR